MSNPKDILIAIDDGHGMETPGKQTPAFPDGTRIKENQFNKPASEAYAAAMQRCGARIMFVAPEDTDAPLGVRVDRANDAKATLFVSWHFNAFRGIWDQTKGGSETHHHPNSAEGEKLAQCIQQEIIKGTPQVNRGVKASNFYVLREPDMPAALIENGFMDVSEEAKLMLNPEFQIEQAEQAAEGTCKYLGIPYIPPNVSVGVPIIGPPSATFEQAIAWARAKDATPWFISLAPIYWRLAPKVGMDPAVPYAQSFKETDGGYRHGMSNAKIDERWNNPCGLKIPQGGSDKDPNAHKKFATPEEGVQAHIDHLALYAGAPGYPKADTPDPRHFSFIRGRAATVEALGGKWAPNPDYGKSIVEGYLEPLKETPAPKLPQPITEEERAMKKLMDAGIVLNDHDFDDKVTWREFAIVVARVLDKCSNVIDKRIG
ncbi:N-acetylmuramoyl-L-alanine amidase [Phosphitispora fastidiosa]|uniref:N-acetylmuramoyl-L-alanine amidase n=1 Tax=Phosphitispora fastidiosa TaxID=2837202 RepID=UPI001E46D5BA|nr:N-acetylmuramoyl-L-alanine amidase [Phosphitispora fastidiosa]MBU7006289.1 N-acetylmuramoyl-L-alanine amidase [Phosphitispora fastidiosa]